MKETIEKAKNNKAVSIGIAGAIGAGSILGYSEQHKAAPARHAEQRIEVENKYSNVAIRNGEFVRMQQKPHEFLVTRDSEGNLAAEAIIGGNPAEGPAIDEALEEFAAAHPEDNK